MKFLDLAKQIFLDNVILVQTDKHIINSAKDKESTKEKINELAEKHNFNKDEEGNYIINKFVLKKNITKVHYSRAKLFAEINPYTFLTTETLHSQFNDFFDTLFKEVVYFGEKIDVGFETDLKLQLQILNTFVSLMEERLIQLKKKL